SRKKGRYKQMQNLQAQKQQVMVVPASVTNGATVTANLDCISQEAVDITVVIGAFAGGTNGAAPATIKLGESDDTVATNFADITGASANAALSASGSVRFNVDLRKRKRFLKLTFAPAATTNDTVPMVAIAEFDRSEQFPANTSGFGNTIVKIV